MLQWLGRQIERLIITRTDPLTVDDIVNDPRLPRCPWQVRFQWHWFRETWLALLGRLYPSRPDSRWWFIRHQLLPHCRRGANWQDWQLGPLLITRPMQWLARPARSHLEILYRIAPSPREVLSAIVHARDTGQDPALILDENSPLMDAARNALAKAAP
jgi:hypothetical protein